MRWLIPLFVASLRNCQVACLLDSGRKERPTRFVDLSNTSIFVNVTR